MLDEVSQEAMKNDLRWWGAEYYKSRHVYQAEDFELSNDELLSIVEQAIPALIKLGKGQS